MKKFIDNKYKITLFNNYMLPHYEDIYKYALKTLADESLAREIAQNAIMKAWDKLGQLKSWDAAGPWIHKIARNEIASLMRRDSSIVFCQYSDEFVPDVQAKRLEQDISDAVVKGEEREYIRKALSRLSKKKQTAVILRYYWDFSDKEIAKATGMNYSTVRVYIHRALKEMKEYYLEIEKGGRK